MDSIEAKALALVNGVKTERGRNSYSHYIRLNRALDDGHEALCRAIEQHEAFRQEVSDIVEAYVNATNVDDWVNLKSLIITEPDPLVEALDSLGLRKADEWAGDIRKALAARGLEIREKGQ